MLMLQCASAWALPGADDAWVLQDRSGRLGLAEIQALPADAPVWRRFGDVLSLGFTAHPAWVRLALPAHQAGTVLHLRLRPVFVDEVTLFIPRGDGSVERQQSGDRTPMHARSGDDTAFELRWQTDGSAASRVVYLRLASTSSIVSRIEVLSPTQAAAQRDTDHLVIGAYFGALLVAWAWSLWRVWQRREAAVVMLSVYLASTILMNVGLLGLASKYLFPASNLADAYTSLMIITTTALASVFHRLLLKSFGVQPLALRITELLVVVGIGNLIAFGLGYVQPALRTNAWLILAGTAGVLWPLWRTWRASGNPLHRTLFIGFAILFAAVLLTLLPLLGVPYTGNLLVHQASLYTLIIAVVPQVLFAHQQARREKAARDVAAQLRAEQGKAAELQRFSAMLAHELKTPLALLRMAFGVDHGSPQSRQRAERCIQDITALIDRVAMHHELDEAHFQPRPERCDLTTLARRVAAAQIEPQRILLSLPDAAPAHVDPALLGIILSNLLDNALKYGDAAAPVRLALKPNGCFTVSNPPGLAGWPDRAQLFAKYQRGAGARRVSGSGLGLHLCAALAERLGATLSYQPEPDLIVFELCLPH